MRIGSLSFETPSAFVNPASRGGWQLNVRPRPSMARMTNKFRAGGADDFLADVETLEQIE
jgi:hypothetical protein